MKPVGKDLTIHANTQEENNRAGGRTNRHKCRSDGPKHQTTGQADLLLYYAYNACRCSRTKNMEKDQGKNKKQRYLIDEELDLHEDMSPEEATLRLLCQKQY